MGVCGVVLLLFALGASNGNTQEEYFQRNRRLAKGIVEALQDASFNDELLFDLKKENQVYLNRTMSLVIKYIVKREVDNYRSRRTDAISRRIYSSLIMKLIDIAKVPAQIDLATVLGYIHPYCHSFIPSKRDRAPGSYDPKEKEKQLDLPRNISAINRVDTAHRYYMSVESRDMHDQMADVQVFHACARLYDIMFTAPRILSHLGNLDDLTPRTLVRKLMALEVKPVHLAIALLIQFHLRTTVNFALRSRAIDILATKPAMVGPQVVDMLKALAARLLPIAELLDVHVAHYSPVFRDTCPSTWLGIVNDKGAA